MLLIYYFAAINVHLFYYIKTFSILMMSRKRFLSLRSYCQLSAFQDIVHSKEKLPSNQIPIEVKYLELFTEDALLHVNPQPEQLLNLCINVHHKTINKDLEVTLLGL